MLHLFYKFALWRPFQQMNVLPMLPTYQVARLIVIAGCRTWLTANFVQLTYQFQILASEVQESRHFIQKSKTVMDIMCLDTPEVHISSNNYYKKSKHVCHSLFRVNLTTPCFLLDCTHHSDCQEGRVCKRVCEVCERFKCKKGKRRYSKSKSFNISYLFLS